MVAYRTLGGWDYAVLGVTLLTSLAIGIYFRFSGGKQKTTAEYLLGDQNQSVIPVALSLMASFMSAVTLLGVAAEIYMHGIIFLTIIASYVLFSAVAAYLYLPVFFNLQTTSTYEYLEQRFGPRVRLAASLLYSLQMVLYMGIVLYAPAIALEALTGLSRNFSVLIVGIVCTLYSTIGGIKAVIWTDVFQSMLMYAAVFSVIGVTMWSHGGFSPIWRIAQEHHRIQFFDFSLDPTVRHSSWSLFIGGGFTFLSLYGVNQTQVQRYLTTGNYKAGVRSLWLNTLCLYLLLTACALSGLCIFSYYYQCDPKMSGRITSLDQLLPLFVMDTMGSIPGISGLFAAGVFSASLSSVSACVNSLAAVTVEDYIKPLMPKSHFTKSTALAKSLAMIYGLVCVGVAFLAQYLGGLLQAGLSIMGIVGGPLLGTFTLGMFIPSANEPGALVGIITSLVAVLLIGFGQPRPTLVPLPLSTANCTNTVHNATLAPTPSKNIEYPYLYRISYLWYVVIGCFITVVVGYLVSQIVVLLSQKPPHPVNPHLLTPPVAEYIRRRQKQNTQDVELKEKMLNGASNSK